VDGAKSTADALTIMSVTPWAMDLNPFPSTAGAEPLSDMQSIDESHGSQQHGAQSETDAHAPTINTAINTTNATNPLPICGQW